MRAGQNDLVAVCAADSECSVRIFPHARTVDAVDLPLERIPLWLTGESCPFRLIRKESIRRLVRYYARNSEGGTGPLPSPELIAHDGIEELTGAGTSQIHYFYHSKWIILPGMD